MKRKESLIGFFKDDYLTALLRRIRGLILSIRYEYNGMINNRTVALDSVVNQPTAQRCSLWLKQPANLGKRAFAPKIIIYNT